MTSPHRPLSRTAAWWLTGTAALLVWLIAQQGHLPLSATRLQRQGVVIPPSLAAPGGLPPHEIPQFVLLTNDDAIFHFSHKHVRAVIDGRQANGCPLAATLFTLWNGNEPYEGHSTDCELVRDLHNRGCEIADHGMSHISLLAGSKIREERLQRERWGSVNRLVIAEEVLGMRQRMEQLCGIPAQDIVGFRTPYLEGNLSDIHAVLHENGFLYDSSLIQRSYDSFSEGFGRRVWPWDMEHGISHLCGSFGDGSMQICDMNASWPGLYEVPVWELSELGGPYTMDPLITNYVTMQPDTNHKLLDVLTANFQAAYGGNRAPFPIFVHVYWYDAGDHSEQLGQFIDYAASLPDVYFVTMRQLLAWMKHPTPASQLRRHPERLGCGNMGGAGPAA